MKSKYFISIENGIANALRDVSKEIERVMLEQLQELVTRGLIRWEQTDMRIVQDCSEAPGKFRICYAGQFVCREEEYIKELEAQNAQLRATLNIGIPKERKYPC